MAYVYRHIRLDKNEVFYIGIGSDDKGHYYRANSKNKKRSGKNHPYFGKSSPKKDKPDIKAKNRALIKIECPHCKKYIQKLSANTWHFDKCKHKQ